MKKLTAFILTALFFSSCSPRVDIEQDISTEAATTVSTTITEPSTAPTTATPLETAADQPMPEPETTAQTTAPEISDKENTETFPPLTEPVQTTAQTTQATTVEAATVAENAVSSQVTIAREEVEEMPEIVFIEFRSVPTAYNVVYGYFINNKGEVRYFEFFDEKGIKLVNEDRPPWTYMQVLDDFNYSTNLLTEMYDTIIEVSVETDIYIGMEKLSKLNEQLLCVDSNSNFEYIDEFSTHDIVFPLFHSFGIRKGADNEYEYILLGADWSVRHRRNDINARALTSEIRKKFPSLSTSYVPELLQER